MTPEMSALLEEEMLVFTPLSGMFDVAAIAQAIGGLGASYHDAIDPEVYALFTDPADREATRAERAADPQATLPYVPLIRLSPTAISLYNTVEDADLRALREGFIDWLTEHQPCRIENEFGLDVPAMERRRDAAA